MRRVRFAARRSAVRERIAQRQAEAAQRRERAFLRQRGKKTGPFARARGRYTHITEI